MFPESGGGVANLTPFLPSGVLGKNRFVPADTGNYRHPYHRKTFNPSLPIITLKNARKRPVSPFLANMSENAVTTFRRSDRERLSLPGR